MLILAIITGDGAKHACNMAQKKTTLIRDGSVFESEKQAGPMPGQLQGPLGTSSPTRLEERSLGKPTYHEPSGVTRKDKKYV